MHRHYTYMYVGIASQAVGTVSAKPLRWESWQRKEASCHAYVPILQMREVKLGFLGICPKPHSEWVGEGAGDSSLPDSKACQTLLR